MPGSPVDFLLRGKNKDVFYLKGGLLGKEK